MGAVKISKGIYEYKGYRISNCGYKLVAKTHRFACGMKATYFLLGFYIE